MLFQKLQNYAQELGELFPKNCGNLLVASQYATPLKLVKRYINEKAPVLDWGCGGGHFSYLLLKENFDVHAFAYGQGASCKTPGLKKISDFEGNFQNRIAGTCRTDENIPEWVGEEALQKLPSKGRFCKDQKFCNWLQEELLSQVLIQAKEKLGAVWNVTNGDDPITLPFLDQIFEGVISLGVLEHVRETGGDEPHSLSEIYRILKPGGYFFCFHFPNRYSWIEAAARFLNCLGKKKYCHLHRYTKKEIMKLLDGTGFQIVEIGLYNLLPRSLLRHIPDWIAYRKETLFIYNMIEQAASLLFKNFSQNYFFVVKK